MKDFEMRVLARLAVATVLVAAPIAAVTITNIASAADDATPVTVLTSDFEDGTVQSWGGRNAEVITNSTAVAHGGTHSLSVTGRTATWNGPALSVLGKFEKGTQYTISVWVRHADGSDNARLSAERRTGTTAAYDTIVGNTAINNGNWTNLVGRYTLASDVDFLSIYVETASGTGSLFIDDVTVTYVPALPIQTSLPSIKDVVTDFTVGAAITGAEIVTQHGDLLKKHFGSVTPGNALKWDATEPTANTFTYTQADPLVNFAKANSLKVRGHTLVWHNQTPAWVFQRADGTAMVAGNADDKALLLSRLENHIRNVAPHYGDTIGTWDVVNEVIDENQSDGLRRSSWYNIAGLDYIRTAFAVARAVVPNATLCINDYNTNVAAKRDKLFALVSQLKGEGIPIDCVGHQMHDNVQWPAISDIKAMLDKFVPLGVTQQITEMDVSIYTNSGENFATPPADRLLSQAYHYRDTFALFRQYKSSISSVTLWGLADDNTWLDTYPVARKDAPLLFDTRLQAKDAYWGVVDPTKIGSTATTSPTPAVTTSSASPSPSTTTPTPTPTSSSPTASPTASPSSNGPTDGPTPSGIGSCSVSYKVVGSWTGGFQGEVKLTNSGLSPVTSWSLGWVYTGGQQVTQLWGGTVTQTGSSVIVKNASWNGALATGASATVGFLGSWTGTNPVPTQFTVNGAICSAA
jgi:endo-1,4-beta-xylanase